MRLNISVQNRKIFVERRKSLLSHIQPIQNIEIIQNKKRKFARYCYARIWAKGSFDNWGDIL